jgi:flagellar motor switch protein FliN/FliY
MSTLNEIEVDLSVELGSAVLPVHHLLRLGRGAIIELDSLETDPLRIYVNNTLVARGEVRIDDGRLSVAVTEKLYRLR